MAKAHLRKAETRTTEPARLERLQRVGRCIEAAMRARGWNLNELTNAITTATETERCPRQVARWMAGQERPQFDVLFAVPSFEVPLLLALARGLASRARVEISTEIRIREDLCG